MVFRCAFSWNRVDIFGRKWYIYHVRSTKGCLAKNLAWDSAKI